MELRSLISLTLLFAVAVAEAAIPTASQREAQSIVTTAGTGGGLIVHIGSGDGRLTAALQVNQRLQIHGLDRDWDDVVTARNFIRGEGLYGPIAVDQLINDRLPYIDNLVNLIVIEDAGAVSEDEIQRVLVPNGVALVRDGESWKKTVKERPKDIDDWSHFLHDASNNAVAHDTVVGPPQHLQWLGSPRWSRHHDRMASMSALVSSAGRLFYIMDEGSRVSIQLPPHWTVVGRDAFNGTVLWKQPIKDWHSHLWPLKSGPTQLARRLVATEDRVFVTLGIEAPLTAIDAITGEIVHTYEDTASTEEILHDKGTLFLLVNKGESDLLKYRPINAVVGDQADVGKNWRWDERPRVVMAVDAKSGKTLWSRQSIVSPLTLGADAGHVFIHDGEKVVCLDRETGDQKWASKAAVRRRTITYNFGPRLVSHENTLLYAGGDRTMQAYDIPSGRLLWEAPHDRSGYQSPEDLLIMRNLVWSAPTTNGKDSGNFTGRDIRTGEVKVEFPPNVEAYWFHHRCYMAKATDRFIIPSRTGIEFVSPDNNDWNINHWVRGGCLYGVMPCNGLLYAPPHNCACYPEAKLYGFNALAPSAPSRARPETLTEEGRLEEGPAFGAKFDVEDSEADWPTFRHDQSRSGSTTVAVPSELGEKWKTQPGGTLTGVTVAGGHLFVATIENHTVHSLNAGSGQVEWSFTSGGRVDSPPTYERGRVYFGCNDGWIYCLRASDGEVVWRYLAAPEDRRLMAFEQLESVWPIHGSVLVKNGSVFAVAGRSNFLDGGLRFLKLDALTGSKLAESTIDEKDPETGGNIQMRHETLQMPVGLPDILSSHNDSIFMKSQRLDQDGKRYEIGPNSGDFAAQASVHAGENAHLFAPMGFLDDTWFHRSYWVYGRSFAGGHGGYFQAGKFAPSGRIMVFDDKDVFGFGRKPENLRWTTVLEHQLFSAPKEAPGEPVDPVAKRRGKAAGAAVAGGSMVRIPKSKKIDPSGQSVFVEAWAFVDKPNGVIVAHGGPANGYALYVNAGKPRFAARVKDELSEATGPESIARKWTHLAGAITSDGQAVLYVNGIKTSSVKVAGLIPTEPAQSIEVGSDDGSAVAEYASPSALTGIIDDVRIIHGDFTAADVEKLIDTPDKLSGKAVVSLNFEDGKATDASGLNNHGTISGAKAAGGKNGQGLQFSGNTGTANKSGGSIVKPHWTKDVPIFVRAMVKAGPTLFVCGPPDMYDESETFERLKNDDATVQKLLTQQDEALNGQHGAILRAVSAVDGSTISELHLDALPVWDGMAAARGALFMTNQNGEVICLGAKPESE